MWVYTNYSVDLSWTSLWSDDFYYFEIITKSSSCFTWSHPSVQSVFYESTSYFTALKKNYLSMRLLIYVDFDCWTIYSSMWVYPNHYVDLSCMSLWSDNFYYFEIITKWSSWFTWSHPSVQLVFYESTGYFTALNKNCLSMRFLIYVDFDCWTIYPSPPGFLL